MSGIELANWEKKHRPISHSLRLKIHAMLASLKTTDRYKVVQSQLLRKFLEDQVTNGNIRAALAMRHKFG